MVSRILCIVFVGLALLAACGGPSPQEQTLEEAGLIEIERNSPEAAAKRAFQVWVDTPYRNESVELLKTDGDFATVRIIAQFRASAESAWLEHEAKVECQKVGKSWRAPSWMHFELTAAEQERQRQRADATSEATRRVAATREAVATAAAQTQLAQLQTAGRILFRRANGPLWVMNADGTEQARLLEGGKLGSWPTMLDGQRIGFESFERDAIYVMNIDGTGQAKLGDFPRLGGYPGFNFALSPDGQRITFISSDDEDYGIYLMNADGTGQVKLVSAGALGNRPCTLNQVSWSPDGQRIFFAGGCEGDMYVVNADGTELKNLTSNIPSFSSGPVIWSSDKQRFAFRHCDMTVRDRCDSDDFDIYVANADGTGGVNITNQPANNQGLAWSPDAQRIAFQSDRDGDFEIYVVNADGTGLVNLTNSPEDEEAPTWSPDGQWIAFVSYNQLASTDSEIYVMNVDGTGKINISNSPHSGQWVFAWLP